MMKRALNFEEEPFEAYLELDEYGEEQPDVYSEFDQELEAVDTKLAEEWEQEARRGRRIPIRATRFHPRPLRPLLPPLKLPRRPPATLPDVPPIKPPSRPAPTMAAATATDSAAVSPCALYANGRCVRCGSCETCERRIRAAPPAQLVGVPPDMQAYPGRAIQMDAQALDAYKKLYQEARAGGITDPYLKITSGYRDYRRQADDLWRPRLLKIFGEFGCDASTLRCVEPAIDVTSRALRSLAVPHPLDTWLNRFRQELERANSSMQCDPQRVQEVARRKNVDLSDPTDAVGSAVRILRRGTAPPGASPHHTGRAIDVFVGKAPSADSSASTDRTHVRWQRAQAPYQWLICNTSRYGFYPYNAEPWHWEYNPIG